MEKEKRQDCSVGYQNQNSFVTIIDDIYPEDHEFEPIDPSSLQEWSHLADAAAVLSKPFSRNDWYEEYLDNEDKE